MNSFVLLSTGNLWQHKGQEKASKDATKEDVLRGHTSPYSLNSKFNQHNNFLAYHPNSFVCLSCCFNVLSDKSQKAGQYNSLPDLFLPLARGKHATWKLFLPLIINKILNVIRQTCYAFLIPHSQFIASLLLSIKPTLLTNPISVDYQNSHFTEKAEVMRREFLQIPNIIPTHLPATENMYLCY